jgi:hypothetical protein
MTSDLSCPYEDSSPEVECNITFESCKPKLLRAVFIWGLGMKLAPR